MLRDNNFGNFVSQNTSTDEPHIVSSDTLSKKHLNIDSYKSSFAQKNYEINHLPLEYFAEVSNKCNLNCIMCAFHDRKWPEKGIMEWGIIEKFTPFLDSALILHAFGFGEPLLNVSQPQLLVMAKKNKVWVDFFTNAMLLNEEKAKLFVEIEVDRITVSIDGATKKTFELIREKGNFEQLERNLNFLKGYKLKTGSDRPDIRINFVCTTLNLAELPLLVEKAKEWGCSGIDVKPLVTHENQPQTYGLKKYYEPELDDQILSMSQATAQNLGIFLNLNEYKLSLKSNKTLENPDKLHSGDERKSAKPMDIYPCFQPFKVLYIKAGGGVKPCCFDHTDKDMGNLNDNTLEEIWFGAEFRSLRKDILAGRVPERCTRCYKFALRPITDDAQNIFDLICSRQGV